MQAAFLSVKLKYIAKEIHLRNSVAKYFLANINNPNIIMPQPGKINEHVWHLFVIRTNNRIKLQQFLTNNGIQTLIHYPIPPHQQECYQYLNHLSLPITEKINAEILSLPISSVMELNDLQKICEVINRF